MYSFKCITLRCVISAVPERILRRRNVFLPQRNPRVSNNYLRSFGFVPVYKLFFCAQRCVEFVYTFQSSFKRVIICLWTPYMRRIYNIMYRQLAGDRVRGTTAAAAAVGNPRFSMMDYCRLAHIIDETKLLDTFMSYVFRFRKSTLMLHVDLQTYPRDDSTSIIGI